MMAVNTEEALGKGVGAELSGRWRGRAWAADRTEARSRKLPGQRHRGVEGKHVSPLQGRGGEGLAVEPGLDVEREQGRFREEGSLVGSSPGKAKSWVGEVHGAPGWGRGRGVWKAERQLICGAPRNLCAEMTLVSHGQGQEWRGGPWVPSSSQATPPLLLGQAPSCGKSYSGLVISLGP